MTVPAKSALAPRESLIGVLVYLLTVFSMATVGAIVPSMMRLCADLNATPAQVGLAISMFSLPSATLGVFGGWVDRFGHRRTLILSTALAVISDVVIYFSTSLLTLNLGLLIAGLAFAGISIAAPAYLMNTLAGPARARAVSLWATYGPTGYALGLIIASPFVDGALWRLPPLLAGVALLACLLAAMARLPHQAAPVATAAAPTAREQVADVVALILDPRMIRLSLALGLPTAISYGTGIVAPSFIHTTYGVSIASSAVLVAAAKIAAMVLGGVAVGRMLAGNMSVHRLFSITAVFGLLAQILLFAPFSGVALAMCAMIVWFFAMSGISATSMMLLPEISPDPTKRALATGLMGQVMSLLCFIAPPLYFTLHWWGAFVIIAVVGLAAGFAILPRPSSKPAVVLAPAE